ncbi:hypothetical protein J3Q64DRAFT_1719971 [Phycomyces blakesleeanus]|uniref:Uncharacterized protein n=2 Tax=Phycomyces blakesleeanus TaxID=4837 RepID=A0A167K014_PHYB8|nr:hypothetical protein PHYBLDRAFT_79781 [Phycomyces blakesleeanus NRRL 1555(-)]OAD67000.1 hypothetical protein PHYBLDRAFT_79781 [Phycomyces blakesleeanus NRRL 1555(-)]|eukprot:XP_018285040.1 hypothetical protein PHYBLDRAFT_79781 [Phycomyces blakesleeanus NRRL 1555(-)]
MMDTTAKVFLLKRLANASHNKIYPPVIVKTEVPLERILLVTRLWNNVREQQEEINLAAQTHESSIASLTSSPSTNALDDWFLLATSTVNDTNPNTISNTLDHHIEQDDQISSSLDSFIFQTTSDIDIDLNDDGIIIGHQKHISPPTTAADIGLHIDPTSQSQSQPSILSYSHHNKLLNSNQDDDPMVTPLPSSVLTPCDWSWLDDAKSFRSLNHEVSDNNNNNNNNNNNTLLTTSTPEPEPEPESKSEPTLNTTNPSSYSYSGHLEPQIDSPILSDSFDLPESITPLEAGLLEDDLSSLVRLITEEQNRMAAWTQAQQVQQEEYDDQSILPKKRPETEYESEYESEKDKDDGQVLAILVQSDILQPDSKKPRLMMVDVKSEQTTATSTVTATATTTATTDCQSILTMCSGPTNQFHRLHFPLIDTSSQSAGPTSSPSSPVLLSA